MSSESVSPSAGSESAAPFPDWTLEVEGLGPIQRATVKPAPLTLLIGDNNSGKSYLATLLWGIYNGGASVIGAGPFQNLPSFAKCLQMLRRVTAAESPQLTHQDLALVWGWFSELLQSYSMAHYLNREGYTPGRIALTQPENMPAPLSLKALGMGDEVAAHGWSMLSSPDRHGSGVEVPIEWQLLNVVLHGLQLSLSWPNHSYLPASRTGFMLLLKTLVRDAVAWRFGKRKGMPAQQLTLPALMFIDWLNSDATLAPPGPYQQEAQRLEESLRGSIEVRPGKVGGPEYRYQLDGAKEAMPMHVSSSMVTELAPIILTLRHAQHLPFLVIEEPEAHLHPRVQRALARTLVRLVRKGVRLVITTHSDLFCQQINNCIKLGGQPDEERAALQGKLGYNADEFLRADEVRGYGFTNLPDGSGSQVTELERSPYGLIMPTFNQELDSLLAETAQIDRAIPYRPQDME